MCICDFLNWWYTRGFQKLPPIQEWQYCHLCFSCAIWNLIGHQNFLAWNIILLYLVIYNFAFTKIIWFELSRKLQMCGNTQMAILSILPLLPMMFICWKPRLVIVISLFLIKYSRLLKLSVRNFTLIGLISVKRKILMSQLDIAWQLFQVCFFFKFLEDTSCCCFFNFWGTPVVVFFKIFRGHKSFLRGHWYPCFGLLVMSALGFQARVDHFLPAFLPVWSSDSPLVWHPLTVLRSAWQPCLFDPRTCRCCLQSLALPVYENW